MVRTSDLILVNLNGKSIGTAMELMLAHELHKPIIGYFEEDNEIHPWLDYVCDRVFIKLEDCLKYIEEYYLI
jgi:nucleoside 2-deoxyribosyltransferase